MKNSIIVGDSLDFRTTVKPYPATDGWTLTYRLVPKTAGVAISFDASADGADYRVQVGPTTTQGWTAGEYSWFAYVSKASERYTVERGTATLLANPATVAAGGVDNRSHARKVLEAIEAVMEARATKTQREMVAYTIGSRSQQFDQAESKTALLTLLSKYRWLVANEDAREQLAAGVPNPRLMRVRFRSP